MDTSKSEERPLCKCHGEPMRKRGQGWRCRVSNRRWYEANREKVIARNEEIRRQRRVEFSVGRIRFRKNVDNKAEVMAAREAFRAEQRKSYQEAADVGFH